ncbi:MAG: DUF6350 family protein [Mycobacterium sp.]
MTGIQGRSPAAADAPQSGDLVRVAFGPSMVAIVVIAAIVLVQLVVANSDLTGTLGAVASLWLAVHQVPVTIAGQQLGALPLAPTALMVWGTARTVAQITPARGSLFVIRWIAASAVGGPLLIAAVALAVVHDAASVITDLQTPNALGAFAGVAVVHGLGALIGIWPSIGRRVASIVGAPGWVIEAVRPALVGVAALLSLSCAVVAASLVVHWGTMHDLFVITDSFVGQLSLALLSLLYLPNVVVGAAAVAVGSSAHIGFATFSAFTVFGGDIPALPILAAAPTPPLGPVWVALLIVGAASGVAIGQQCARLPLPLPLAFAKLAVACALAAVILAVLAVACGGALGNFGDVGVDQVTFGPGVFFWFFVIGGLTVSMAGGVRRGPAAGVVGKPSAPPMAEAEPEPRFESGVEAGVEAGVESGVEAGVEVGVEYEPEPEAGVESESEADLEQDESAAEAEPEPTPPPPPVTPAPDLEEVEDLMFVDADIEDDAPPPAPGPPG